MRPRLPLLYALLAAAAVAAQSQPRDALESAECRQALAALRLQEQAAVAEAERGAGPVARDTLAQRLAPARQRAARACLQGRADAPPPAPGRFVTPPLTVPPVAMPAPLPAPPSVLPMPATPLPPALPRPAPPASITSCDALGCWASDGTRLQRAGPNLLGPRGFCSAPGGVLSCP
ncbi:hypothetical protein [Azohydromonas aeria]|uniref:hypothetical protein n=1 Tax=Azohydromonas aeria TaxID=2590212 RepID=UPI0012F913A7|nr:hypothetical protein [Azohydromonas aeria]